MALDQKTLTFAMACFKHHQLFGVLDDFALKTLLGSAVQVRFTAGGMIFQKEDAGEVLYLIIEGRVKVITISESGKEIILNILEKGEIFGEIAFLDGKTRTATTVALEDCHLISVRRTSFMSLMTQYPQLIGPLIGVLCARLRWVSESYEDAVFHHLPQRLARILLILSERQDAHTQPGESAPVAISQADLGRTLGISREKINRQLKVWQRSGILSLKRSEVWIHDRARLAIAIDNDD